MSASSLFNTVDSSCRVSNELKQIEEARDCESPVSTDT